MDSYQPLAWAAIGAAVLVAANVAFAWFATAPDHYEWTDPALFMSPLAALVGAFIGAGAARIRLALRKRREKLEH